MINRLFRIISTLILVTVLLSACTGSSSGPSSQPLRVGWSMWAGWYPLVIAQEKGFFEKNGVQVELVYYDAYEAIMPAIASGMVDVGGLSLADTLMNDVAEDVKILMITDASHGAGQMMAAPEIKTVQDLRGKRIGVPTGTYAEVFVQEMLDKNNILRSEVTLVEVAAEDVPGSIPSLIDAGHTFEPYASQARAIGLHSIFSTADTPGLLVDVFAFRKDAVQNRPGDVRGFINAWFESVTYWQEHPEEGNAIIAQALGIAENEISLEGIKIYTLADNIAAFQETTETTSIYYPAKLENQFFLDQGVISYPIQIDSEFLDPSFLKPAGEE